MSIWGLPQPWSFSNVLHEQDSHLPEKVYDENYSKIIRWHKYKDNDKDNVKDKDTDKAPETPNI